MKNEMRKIFEFEIWENKEQIWLKGGQIDNIPLIVRTAVDGFEQAIKTQDEPTISTLSIMICIVETIKLNHPELAAGIRSGLINHIKKTQND
jgi:hypothetical protein